MVVAKNSRAQIVQRKLLALGAATVAPEVAAELDMDEFILGPPRVWRRSQGNAALPGNKIVLPQGFGFSADLAAGHLNDPVQDLRSNLFNCLFTGNDAAGIEINNVGHPLCQR